MVDLPYNFIMMPKSRDLVIFVWAVMTTIKFLSLDPMHKHTYVHTQATRHQKL